MEKEAVESSRCRNSWQASQLAELGKKNGEAAGAFPGVLDLRKTVSELAMLSLFLNPWYQER
ncbi:hypothetical protein SCA6_004621 [Theobroma cacao]